MMGKTGLYNYIRDEVRRLLSGGGLGVKIEPLGRLPDAPDRRPADLLTIPSALCRQSSWHFLPWIAIDFVVVSPFRAAREHLATEDYATTNRLSETSHARYLEQGIGFEPVVFDHAGGVNEEGARILDSLSKAVGGPTGRQAGRIRLMLHEQISIALQRYVSHCFMHGRAGVQGKHQFMRLGCFLD